MNYKLSIRLFIYRVKMKGKAIAQKISRIFNKPIPLPSLIEGRFAYKKIRRSFNVKRPSFYVHIERQKINALRYDQILAKRKRSNKGIRA